MVGLTNDDPATNPPVYNSLYTLCDQFVGSVNASADATVMCSPSCETFRFVVIHGSHATAEALCLKEVKVYGTSK